MSILRYVLILSLSVATAFGSEKVVRLSAPDDHPVRETALKILTLAYSELGYRVDALKLPPARSLHMANVGEVDGELFRGDKIEKDYKKLIRIPIPIERGEIIAVVDRSNGDTPIDGWESLETYKIGAQIGIKTVEIHTEGYDVSYVAEVDQLILQLLHNRIDLAVGPKPVFLKALNSMVVEGLNEKLPLADIVFLEPAVETGYLYHYLHESKIDLAVDVTRVLQRMEDEGVIDAIRKDVNASRYSALEQLH